MAVCRDREGNYLGSCSLVIDGVDDPATLEAIACHEAFALAGDFHLQSFVIASDSKQVAADFTSGSRGSYGAIVSGSNLKHLSFLVILLSKVVLSIILKHIV